MKILVFGGNGAIGQSIVNELQKNIENEVFVAGHKNSEKQDFRFDTPTFEKLLEQGPFSGVVWAGGKNVNDSIENVDLSKYEEVLEANLNFILRSLNFLIVNKALNKKSSLVIISSIWQNISRNNKFSYSVSKAALAGLIKSAAIDLGKNGIRVNSVSPGVILNNMTRKNLSESQISKISHETPLQELVTEIDVANVILWLLSGNSQGITGQDIVVDGGWTISRYV